MIIIVIYICFYNSSSVIHDVYKRQRSFGKKLKAIRIASV